MFALRRSGCSRWTDLGVQHGPKPALLLLLVPLAIGAIWSLVDLLRSRSIVEEINNQKAAEIARQMGIRAKISVAKLCRRGGAGR